MYCHAIFYQHTSRQGREPNKCPPWGLHTLDHARAVRSFDTPETHGRRGRGYEGTPWI